MALYVGSAQTFLNRLGSNTIREIYLGNKGIMTFEEADYVSGEITTTSDSSSYPIKVTETSSGTLSISTNNYNSGYAYSKYYCDHIKVTFTYGGSLYIYDYQGNTVITATSSFSFSYSSGKYTIGETCAVNGTTLFNSSTSSSSISSSLLTYEIYYDTSNKRWVVIWNGTTYTSATTDWAPTYFRLRPQFWSIITTISSTFIDGNIAISYMNRARGYPDAN